MPIAATDLVPYCAANMPEDDASTCGGAIDTTMRIYFADIKFLPTDVIEVISDTDTDTSRTITVYVMDSYGNYVSETQSVEGVDPVDFDSFGSIDRIEKVVLSSTHGSATVTIRVSSSWATIATIPPNEKGFTRLFYKSFSSQTAPKIYYSKFFWKNINNTYTLDDAVIAQPANPSGEILFTLANTVNDVGSTTNRITAPGPAIVSPVLFTALMQDVPNGGLAPNMAIGVWVSMTLTPGQNPIKTTFTSQIYGGTPA